MAPFNCPACYIIPEHCLFSCRLVTMITSGSPCPLPSSFSWTIWLAWLENQLALENQAQDILSAGTAFFNKLTSSLSTKASLGSFSALQSGPAVSTVTELCSSENCRALEDCPWRLPSDAQSVFDQGRSVGALLVPDERAAATSWVGGGVERAAGRAPHPAARLPALRALLRPDRWGCRAGRAGSTTCSDGRRRLR